MLTIYCSCWIEKYFRGFRPLVFYRRHRSLNPAGWWSPDVSVWTQRGTKHHRWPHENQGWLRDGSPLAGPCTAGSTGCGPSRGALWRAAPSSAQCTAWSCKEKQNKTIRGFKMFILLTKKKLQEQRTWEHWRNKRYRIIGGLEDFRALAKLDEMRSAGLQMTSRESGNGCVVFHKWLSPEVFAVVKVPSGRVAHHLTAFRFNQHGVSPKLLRHLHQSNRCEELFSNFEHL